MRVGLFGGSFDPVHYGHLLLAEACREQCRLDEVWFLPAAQPPHKRSRQVTPDQQRVEMLELAVADNPAFVVSRYEIDRGGVSYTVDTLEHFRQEDAGRELFLLVGADMLRDLPHWHRAERLCELAVVAAAGRPAAGQIDFDVLAAVTTPERIELFRRHRVEMPECGLSSTDLRRRIAEGRSIRHQTPRAVEEYIRSQGLYRLEASEGIPHSPAKISRTGQ